MPTTLAFDVYGTLIDTHGITSILEKFMGNKADAFSHTWRNKQLEYSFRRGLMQSYQNFAVCTANALDYSCQFHRIELTTEQKKTLLESYKTLPCFDDVITALKQLNQAGFRLFAFSNGSQIAVNQLLESAGISELFNGVVSCDDVQSFKPNPAVYAHFLRESETKYNEAWLISSNPFDVIGAISVGMQATWVKRSEEAIFDPWGIEPTATVSNLSMLQAVLQRHQLLLK
ncbi:haloacid dehalogenase type II [Vibrio sp. DW001]|uniref:haloacid dehalogenase type II n=1 Tax=Vibrio sp. DW001 TaxID=2912315 RepID=UPI0023AFD74B|nr:haloacid dehalogenase type II [Vibrio sp. DW001]WED29499.1 haloacid dehalogenase type II [Vibrio sp. DW001]